MKKITKLTKEQEAQNELWKFPLHTDESKRVFNKEVHFARYLCPSTREYMVKGVPDMKTIAEAMAWGQSDDTHIITAEEWKRHIPLVTAS
jgi:hypothetical protein